jgi:hypothetical protein
MNEIIVARIALGGYYAIAENTLKKTNTQTKLPNY